MSEHLIPNSSRRIVTGRDLGLCVRCGHKGGDWHHRRGRSVPGLHRHCPCNGLTLCRTCHSWAHAYPLEAMEEGLVVSRFCEAPFMVPVATYSGWWLLSCTGCATFVRDDQLVYEDGIPYVTRPHPTLTN